MCFLFLTALKGLIGVSPWKLGPFHGFRFFFNYSLRCFANRVLFQCDIFVFFAVFEEIVVCPLCPDSM